jgi:hypothetical protein
LLCAPLFLNKPEYVIPLTIFVNQDLEMNGVDIVNRICFSAKDEFLQRKKAIQTTDEIIFKSILFCLDTLIDDE